MGYKITDLDPMTAPALTDLVECVDVSDAGGTGGGAGGTGKKTTLKLALGVAVKSICQGRLTLTSGTAVTTSDVTAATSIYFTPYNGNLLGLYNGTAWELWSFTELTLSLSGLTLGKNYDVFVYDSSGTLTLEAVVWTDDTTRATALTTQDGIYVKSGTTTKRYLGTFRTTGTTGQCEDSAVKRFVYNAYNKVSRALLRQESASSWNYTSATVRQVNGSTANQVEVVVGLQDTRVQLNGVNLASQASSVATLLAGIGENSTTTISTNGISGRETCVVGAFIQMVSSYNNTPRVGYSFLAWLEGGQAAGTTTWYGNTTGAYAGISGRIDL